MKRRYIQFSLIAIMAFCFLYFQTESVKEYKKIPRGMGTQEDPNARLNFEWMKLRNPYTNEIPVNIKTKELEFSASIPSKSEYAGKGQLKTSSADWSWKGPANISGRTRAFRFDVTNNDENTIIAGGIAGGMWKSTDGGNSWTKKTRNDQLQSVSCVAQDPRTGFGNVWYYGTGEKTGGSAGAQGESAAYTGNGIFKSTDNGETWELLASTASNTPGSWDNSFDYVWDIEVDQNGNVFAACAGETFVSTDGGANWTTILADGFSGNYSDFAITTTGTYYSAYSSDAEKNAGIWKSTDGTNFTDITPANFPAAYNRIQMAIAPSNEKVLYVIADLGDKQNAFWKYTDGEGWEDRSQNFVLTFEQEKPFDSQGGYDLAIGVKPDDENFVVVAGVDVWRSTDGFASTDDNRRIGGTGFTTLDYPNHFPDHHVIRFLPSNPKVMYVANDGGIYKTMDVTNNTPDADGVTVQWSFVSSKSYNTTLFFGIDIDKATSGSEMIVGGMQDRGNFRRANGSNDWPEVSGGDGMMAAVADGGSWFVSSTQSGAISRYEGSDYKTETWIKPAGAEGNLWVTPYYLDPSDNNIMYYAAGEFLLRNNNVPQATDIDGWEKLNNSQHSGETISAIAVSKNNASNVVYYGTDNGKIYKLNNANSGDPTPETLSAPGEGSYLSSLYVDPQNSDKVILAYSNYGVVSIYLSTDGGQNWSNISGNLEENNDGSGNGPSVRWATFVDVAGEVNYFVGTSVGLYSTTTLSGTSTKWEREGASSIGHSVVVMLIPRESDNYLAVATHGSGVFSAYIGGQATTNNPPTISLSPEGPYTVEEESTLSIKVIGKDNDAGATLTYSATSLPTGATLDKDSGDFAWTPSMGQAGSFNIDFKVTDNEGASANKSAAITVTEKSGDNNPPTLTLDPNGPFEITEGSELKITLAGKDTDANSTLTYSSTELPDGAKLNNTTGNFSWTPNYDAAGDVSITFYVTDEKNASDSAVAQIKITNTNRAPVFTQTLNDQEIAVGSEFTFQYKGNDPDGDAIGFDIDSAPDGSNISEDGLFNWTPSDAQANSSFDIVVVVYDNEAEALDTATIKTGSVTDIADFSGLPNEFALKQNYPNPFNPTSTIVYALPEVSDVSISIYDIKGTLIKSFTTNTQNAGYYNVVWNGKNQNGSTVASGTYIYRLEATPLESNKEKFVSSKKMILMK